MNRDKLAELIAQAIYERARVYGQPLWCDLPESQRGHPRDLARAVIADIEVGYYLEAFAATYRAMIAAAARELEARVGQPTSYFIPDDAVFIDAGGTVRRIKPGEG